MVECYPYSNVEEVIHYLYWREAPTLRLDDELPLGFDEDALARAV